MLGQKIRAAREKTGLSQEAFAPEVGMTRRHLIRVEGGRNQPGSALLDRIAERTGMPRATFTNTEAASADDAEAADVPTLLMQALRLAVREFTREGESL